MREAVQSVDESFHRVSLHHTPAGYPIIFATSPVTRITGTHSIAAKGRRPASFCNGRRT